VLSSDASQIEVISGGFDPACFSFKPKVFHGVVEMVYAGKLSGPKGLPWLLKSLNQIKEMPFRLHVAGSSTGAERDACIVLARSLKDKCVFHGVLSHADLGKLMQQSHWFILPSFFEGVPLVLMEALACGCRILATALPGVKEIFSTASDQLVRLIELPELETIDRPYEKDEPVLEKQLAKMLKNNNSGHH
jgi:glycosyltransferase involved in cell wall biosynthesis